MVPTVNNLSTGLPDKSNEVVEELAIKLKDKDVRKKCKFCDHLVLKIDFLFTNMKHEHFHKLFYILYFALIL